MELGCLKKLEVGLYSEKGQVELISGGCSLQITSAVCSGVCGLNRVLPYNRDNLDLRQLKLPCKHGGII